MPTRVPPELCVRCKGFRRLCGRVYCPILVRFRASIRTLMRIRGDDVEGATPPGILVGEHGYPSVSLAPAVAPERGSNVRIYDDPSGWWGKIGLRDIIELRSSTIYPRIRINVNIGRSSRLPGLVEEIQLASVSLKPVDVEAKLKRPPVPVLRFDGIVTPTGPSAPLESMKVVGNPKLDRRLERIIGDLDVRAKDAMLELYTRGTSIYSIIRSLSVGVLGRSLERRIVPTRWAITAVDSTISEHLRRKLLEMRELDRILIYRSVYLHNNFVVLLLPGAYSLEMIEVWHPRAVWTGEASGLTFNVIYELWDGIRRGPMDGGYYAIRMGALEGMYKRLRRQAVAVVIREVLPEYSVPVGNWHIRESVRRAFETRPHKADSLEEALEIVDGMIRFPVRLVVEKSRLIKRFMYQRDLTSYLEG